jgi:PIN domain
MSLALLDTCVLYPRYLRDVLLNMAEDELYAPLWSAEILTELRRNLVHRDEAANVDGMIRAMRHAFPDAEVTGFERLIPAMTNHPKDRHVLAAAGACRLPPLAITWASIHVGDSGGHQQMPRSPGSRYRRSTRRVSSFHAPTTSR